MVMEQEIFQPEHPSLQERTGGISWKQGCLCSPSLCQYSSIFSLSSFALFLYLLDELRPIIALCIYSGYIICLPL